MKHLFIIQFQAIRNRFRRMTFLEEAKAALFLLVIFALFSVIYLGAWRLLSYLSSVPLIGHLLVNKLCALLFLTSFAMVAFSGLVTAFTTIFFSKDLSWLMASPLSPRATFTFKALQTAFYASWMVLVALVPFLLALGQVKGAGLAFYLWGAALLVPFLVLASFSGIAVSLLLMRYFPVRRTRDLLLFVGMLFITGLYVLLRFMQPERLVKPDGMEIVAQYLSYLDAPTAVYLPSWWLTGALLSLAGKAGGGAVFYSTLLFAGAAAAALAVTAAARRIFFTGWAEGQVFERAGKAKKRSYRTRPPLRALLEKDARVFFRDTNQWSQLMVLGALTTVYLFSIYRLPLDTMYLQNLVSFFNVLLIGFILSAVALRFVFPLVSLEGDTLYLVRAAPLKMSRYLLGKFLFGSAPVLILGLALALASNWLLKADFAVFWISCAATLMMAAGLNAMAVGFGAAFPRFNLTNIAQIESSAGGLLYMLTALVYLGVNASLWALPLQNYYRHKFGGAFLPWTHLWGVALALLAVNAAALVVPLWAGLKSMEELEQ
ncbi:MAG: putative ABC transporter permease subunit [Endomicrobiales bacterium]